MVKQKKLHVVLLGMDERAQATMAMFLERRCRNNVVIVAEKAAEISVIDMDAAQGERLFQEAHAKFPGRPAILLSLVKQSRPGTLYVPKPVAPDVMALALDQITIFLNRSDSSSDLNQENLTTHEIAATRHDSRFEPSPEKTVHQVAMQFDGRRFLTAREWVDLSDQTQVDKMRFNPKEYLLGSLLSAFRVACAEQSVVRLETGWKPIIVIPETRRVWVDADDRQLRSVAKVPVSSVASFDVDSQTNVLGASLYSVDKAEESTLDSGGFQAMESFLWKLALWTANGRVPDNIHFTQPVFLSRWPNLTRCIVSPHALRIAALWVQGPRTLFDLANVLDIRHDDVLNFFTAAYALGFAGQARRQSDTIVVPPPIQPRQHTGLLRKILFRLRGS